MQQESSNPTLAGQCHNHPLPRQVLFAPGRAGGEHFAPRLRPHGYSVRDPVALQLLQRNTLFIEDAINKQCVKMQVQIQCRAKALDQCYRACISFCDLEAHLVDQVSCEKNPLARTLHAMNRLTDGSIANGCDALE